MLTRAVARYQAGDREAFTEIAMALESDVKSKSRAQANYVPGYDVEDVEQELLLMLEEAATKYDPSYGTQFRTFFWRLAHKRIANLQRAQSWDNRKGHHTAVYYEQFRDADDGEGGHDDYRFLGIHVEEGYAETEVLHDILSLSDVTEREREIVRLKLEGYTNREVNSMIGGREYYRADGAYIRCEVDRVLATLRKKVAYLMVA